MMQRRETDPNETPLDPDVTQTQPPLSGTVDDDDNADDERWDENEPPTRPPNNTDESAEESPPADEWQEDVDVEPDLDGDDED